MRFFLPPAVLKETPFPAAMVPKLIHPTSWRDCLKNSQRAPQLRLWMVQSVQIGLLGLSEATCRAPVRGPIRIFRQSQKRNSANFASTEFYEVRRARASSSLGPYLRFRGQSFRIGAAPLRGSQRGPLSCSPPVLFQGDGGRRLWDALCVVVFLILHSGHNP